MGVERTKQMIEVMQAYVDGKLIQISYDDPLNWTDWVYESEPLWDWSNNSYRIAPVTKPSINWDEVSDDYNYLVQGMRGNLFLYKEKPLVHGESGWVGYGSSAGIFKSATPGTCDWKDSIVERPFKGD